VPAPTHPIISINTKTTIDCQTYLPKKRIKACIYYLPTFCCVAKSDLYSSGLHGIDAVPSLVLLLTSLSFATKMIMMMMMMSVVVVSMIVVVVIVVVGIMLLLLLLFVVVVCYHVKKTTFSYKIPLII
jgi:hypothetical protein